ncbi:HEAT repeat domain-containing protein [Parvularcula marina]|uniref:HEAT repeat domain-containing protein n=1 Tax=Parvularcula marina TaxID=2292771 RepID=UPI0035120C49
MKQLVIAASILMLGGAAEAAPDMSTVANCQTVESCIALIDSALVLGDTGISYPDTEEVAELLKDRFGEPMRQALIERAVNGSEEWLNYAGDILSHWGDWDASYLAVLKPAFDRNPEGWMARIIGEIGTDEALDMLMAAVAAHGGGNQAITALRKFPDKKILDRVLPYFEPEGPLAPDVSSLENWPWGQADTLLAGRRERAAEEYASQWKALALTLRAPLEQRIAALRAVAAIGPLAFEEGPELRILASDPEPMSSEAKRALLILTDPSVARLAFFTCKDEFAKQFVSSDEDYLDPEGVFVLEWCLREIATFGPRAGDAFDDIAPYTAHPKSEVRSAAIEALAGTDLPKAIPLIEPALKSPDWREVLSALYGLVRLEAAGSIEKINDVVSTHWWSEIRYFAGQAVELIAGTRTEWSKSPTSDWEGLFISLEYFVGIGPADQAMACKWGNQMFKWPDMRPFSHQHELAVPGGTLIGIDGGEFGGELIFRPNEGEEVVLWQDNIIALFNDGDDIIALSGLSHLSLTRGYAVRVEKEDGKWQAHFIGQFPAKPERNKYLGNNQYAILADGWPVIFDAEEILGVADCETVKTAN